MGEPGRSLAVDVSQQGSLSSDLGPSQGNLSSDLGPSQGLHLLKPSPLPFVGGSSFLSPTPCAQAQTATVRPELQGDQASPITLPGSNSLPLKMVKRWKPVSSI